MIPEDFFEEDFLEEERLLNRGLLKRLRANAYADRSDAEVATALLRLGHDELRAYVEGGSRRLDEEEIRLVVRTSRRLLDRLGVVHELPFSDYSTFWTYWVEHGDETESTYSGVAILNNFFEPIHLELEEIEDHELASTLARPITSRDGTGWTEVDEGITELRRHFRDARSSLEYRNIGNDCDAILERLSEIVFDPELHLKEGVQEPPVKETKNRIGSFVANSAPNQGTNEKIRKLANATIEMTQAVKHKQEGTRKNAGIAADSVILLANMLRRLAEE